MHTFDRRKFLKAGLAAGTALPFAVTPPPSAAKNIITGPRLGFSLYGTKSLSLDDAIKTCGEIGYDFVELCLLPGYPTDPTQFGKAARKKLIGTAEAAKIKLIGMMENLTAVTSDAEHQKNLDRIARAAELAHDIGGNSLPNLETTLGGKPADWPNVRSEMIDRLNDWAETAEKHDCYIAIKPHVNGAVHRPEAASELLEAQPLFENRVRLRAVYDYSHYRAQGLSLEETYSELFGWTVFVHIKDVRLVDGKAQFLLPGDGDTDYAKLFRMTFGNFSMPIAVEVSGQISGKPDYDPRKAAKHCWDRLDAQLNSKGPPTKA